MEAPQRHGWVDLLGSIGVGLVLVVFGLWGLFEGATARRMVEVFADLGAMELPTASRFVFQFAGTGLLEVLIGGPILLGMAALFLIRDRLRANVTALVFALLAGGLAVIVRTISFLPLLKVILEVGA